MAGEHVIDQLVCFYNGWCNYPGGLSFDQIMDKDDEWWEGCHDHIQWVFPNPTPSAFNPNAPLLKKDHVDVLDKARADRALGRFLRFLGLGKDYWLNPRPYWMQDGDHNLLRITRMLIFLKLTRKDSLAGIVLYSIQNAVQYYDEIDPVDNPISEKTKDFWYDATMKTWEDYE